MGRGKRGRGLNEKNIVTAEATARKIEEVKKETGKLPKLILIDHFDYMLGNEHDIRGIAKVAKEHDVPFLCNGAYAIGVLPVNGKEIGADFLVGSGHKSFASPAPSGIVATTNEWAEKVFRITQMVGDVTKRKFGIKEVEMLGCTLMGANLIAMMASFPAVKERVKHWDDEVKKTLTERIPLKKYGLPEDVAEVVVFLVSEKSRYITGEIVDVNGGMLMD